MSTASIELVSANRILAASQSKNWPSYRSFKTVKAAMIVEVPEFTPNQEVGKIVVEVDDYIYDVVINPKQLFSRGLAKPGDYYVVYEDGYDSWSPQNAFEKGYLLLSGSPEDNVSLNATKQDWNFIRTIIKKYIPFTSLEDSSEEEREAVEGFLRMTEECVAKPVKEGKDNV
jgi:hypothetical protein